MNVSFHICLARRDIPWISPTIFSLRDLTSYCVGDSKNISSNTHVAAIKRFARWRAARRSAVLGWSRRHSGSLGPPRQRSALAPPAARLGRARSLVRWSVSPCNCHCVILSLVRAL